MPFQTQVNATPAIGVPGKIASNNPRSTTVITDNGGGTPLTAGPSGLTVARFAWLSQVASPTANAAVAVNTTTGTSAPDGFVLNDGTSIIPSILDEATMVIPAGYQATLLTRGDVFAVTVNAPVRGQKAFASTTDGTIAGAPAGATVQGFIETKFTILQSGAAGDIIKIGTDV